MDITRSQSVPNTETSNMKNKINQHKNIRYIPLHSVYSPELPVPLSETSQFPAVKIYNQSKCSYTHLYNKEKYKDKQVKLIYLSEKGNPLILEC